MARFCKAEYNYLDVIWFNPSLWYEEGGFISFQLILKNLAERGKLLKTCTEIIA